MVNDTAVIPIAPRGAFGDQPTCVSLFSGCGGLDIGFRWAGFRPVWANDIDPVAVDTYRAALPGHTAVAGDISSLAERPGLGDADIVIGGPPCQGFSVAGRMDPRDPRSRHVWTFLEMVEDVRPRAFVMENVKALAANRRWTGLLEGLKERADDLGFDVQLHLLNAADFGVPQARERMFLIGIRRGEGAHVAPHAVTAIAQPTLRSALEALPPYGSPGNDTVCPAKITIAKAPVLRRSPWAGMLFNGAGRPMDLDRPAPTLPASMGGNKTPIIDQLQLEEGAAPWVVDYHAHLWDGGNPWKRVPSHLRRITVEEAAAIQTFPAGMAWAGPQSARYRQIGNAVPPELAYRVALSLRHSLGLDAGAAVTGRGRAAKRLAAARPTKLATAV
jgi:DNA (cytosine-5)-methyltransferase 1